MNENVGEIIINNHIVTVDSGILSINGSPIGSGENSIPFTNGSLTVTSSGIGINNTEPNIFTVTNDEKTLDLNSNSINTSYGLSINSGSGNTVLVAGSSSITVVNNGNVSLHAGSSDIHLATDGGDVTLAPNGSINLNSRYDLVVSASQGNILLEPNGYTDAGNKTIHNLHDPAFAQDAATRHYCDTLTSIGTLSSLTVSGQVGIINTVDSVSTSTGSSITSGGIGVAKSVTIGNILSVLSTTDAISSGTGSVLISGGASIAKKLQVGGGINMNSNLITLLSDPINAQDAATRNYCDTNFMKMYTNTTTLYQSDLLGLNSGSANGVTIVPSVSGHHIIPVTVEFSFLFDSIPYTCSGNFLISYAGGYPPTMVIPTNANSSFRGAVDDSLLCSSGNRRLVAFNSNTTGLVTNNNGGDDLTIWVDSPINVGDGVLVIRTNYYLYTPL